MSPNTVLLIVALVAVVFLVLAGGLLWYWRQRTVQSKAAQKKPLKSQAEKRPASSDGAAPAQSTAASAGAPGKPASVATSASIASSRNNSNSDDGEKIRILIVDDNPDTRENVSRLLYFEKDLELIGQAVNGRQGLEMAIKMKPHIVLMDINMPDMDGITATREMGLKAPFSQVIIMSVQAEQHYMRQAMAAGARDFQPKPFTVDELVSCIRRVYKIGLPVYRQLEAAEQSQGQLAAQPQNESTQVEGAPVIAVYSPKGGIGTSTIAANLAVALQQQQGDVVLMDADLQFGDILVHLNTKATRTISDLIQNEELDAELVPEITLAHNSGLKLLLAPPQPQLADAITPAMVSEVIKSLKKHCKIVVIDTTSQLNDKTLTVLDNADFILVVSTPELPSIKSTKLFLELADQLEFSAHKLGVVINRANLPGGISPDKIEKALKLSQAYRIPYDPKMHLAINKGLALTQQEANAPSAQAVTYIAQDLWQKLGDGKAVPVAEIA
ncbi:MAG: response regulator [Anaerolineae bacterium]|nr:response regulator [Anaerolineae bacterium]